MLRVVRNHRRAAHGATEGYEELSTLPVRSISMPRKKNSWPRRGQRAWDERWTFGEEFGFRNAQTTVIAPTGTIGLVMIATRPASSPITRWSNSRSSRAAVIQDHQPLRAGSAANLGYEQGEIDDIVGYAVGHGTLEDARARAYAYALRAKGFDEKTSPYRRNRTSNRHSTSVSSSTNGRSANRSALNRSVS